MTRTTLSPSERRHRLQAGRGAWTPMTLAQSLDTAVAAFADRPFIITDERHWSYREIQLAARRVAAGLWARGVRPRDHVGMLLANHVEFVIVKYAIAAIGGVAVPINYLLRAQELTYVLEQADCTALVTMDGFRDRDYLAELDAILPNWTAIGGGTRLPRLRQIVVHETGGGGREGALSLTDLAAAANPADFPPIGAADPHFRSDVIYTSGTTGRPKGVMLSHDMILRAAYASAYTRAFEDGRRILFSLPMYHVFGYVECLVACSFVGGAIVPRLTFDARDMLGAAERHAANEMVCVPMMTLKLLDAGREHGFDGADLLAMFNSGGPSPPTIWHDIRTVLGAREMLTAYGMTETTASTTCTLPEGPDAHLLQTNGQLKPAGIAGDPHLHGVLAIYKAIDPVTRADLPAGEMGELLVRGPVVTRGYYEKPAETAAAIDAEGWLHTGDLGSVSAEGFVTLDGRLKETYRCGGEMVMPREVEEVLTSHPLVAQAYVVGLPDPRMGEIGCACIVATGPRPSADELIALCGTRLARFKVPRQVVFIPPDAVPMTATGRPQRGALADLARRHLALVT